MKKILVSSVLILGLVTAGAASANWHRGNGNNGPQKNYGSGAATNVQLSEEDRDKFVQFQKNTVELRRELTVKKAEERAILKSDNPDPDLVAKLSGEIFDLKASLKEKAEAAGIEKGPRAARVGGAMMKGGKGRISLDQATIEKMKQFTDENSAAYKELTMKQAEKRALMRNENVDPAKAAEVAGELFDMRLSLQEKAEAAGVPYYAMMMGQHGGKMKQGGGRQGNMDRGMNQNGWGW